MRLLTIRPQPGADASAARACAAGFDPLVMPLFTVCACEWEVPDGGAYDALLLTSANAVRHGGAGLSALRALPVHTVGERTATAAKSAGLSIKSTGTADAQAVLHAAAIAGDRRLLWLAGEDHRALPQSGPITLDVRVVYASQAIDPGKEAAAVIATADAVALHSPRAARHFAETIDRIGVHRSSLIVAAFSPAIAEAAGSGWRAVAIAEEPNDSALLSALDRVGKAMVNNSLPEGR
ncbi:MAG: hypothetical protein RL481_1892 [Pseudomonadota bacterium]|jgi:uroporphyrinogen-III synthase